MADDESKSGGFFYDQPLDARRALPNFFVPGAVSQALQSRGVPEPFGHLRTQVAQRRTWL